VNDMFSTLLQLLNERIADQSWATGYQLAIIRGNKTLIEASGGVDGLGRPISPDSMFPIYCAGKPITAIAIGTLIDAGELSFDDVLGDILRSTLNQQLAAVTVEQLLMHTAGLWPIPAAALLTLHRSARRRIIAAFQPTPQPPGVGHYADFASWELLSQVIEDLTDEPFVRAIDHLVLERCGLDTEIVFSATAESPTCRRLRINADLQTSKPIPLLWEQSKSNLLDVRPSGGAIATMSALAALYQAVLTSLPDDSNGLLTPSTARLLTTPATVAAHDPVLGRTCRYSPGFMTDLSLPEFDTGLSEQTFGHSGLHGMTFAAADPTRDISFAVHLNGITQHNEPVQGDPNHSPLARRRLICQHIAGAVHTEQP
jgi:CubicO group peptidase (beta-lactamase class C family)